MVSPTHGGLPSGVAGVESCVVLVLNTSEPGYQLSELPELEERVLKEIAVDGNRVIEGENWETSWVARTEEKRGC
jgi:hypothetical protein